MPGPDTPSDASRSPTPFEGPEDGDSPTPSGDNQPTPSGSDTAESIPMEDVCNSTLVFDDPHPPEASDSQKSRARPECSPGKVINVAPAEDEDTAVPMSPSPARTYAASCDASQIAHFSLSLLDGCMHSPDMFEATIDFQCVHHLHEDAKRQTPWADVIATQRQRVLDTFGPIKPTPRGSVPSTSIDSNVNEVLNEFVNSAPSGGRALTPDVSTIRSGSAGQTSPGSGGRKMSPALQSQRVSPYLRRLPRKGTSSSSPTANSTGVMSPTGTTPTTTTANVSGGSSGSPTVPSPSSPLLSGGSTQGGASFGPHSGGTAFYGRNMRKVNSSPSMKSLPPLTN